MNPAPIGRSWRNRVACVPLLLGAWPAALSAQARPVEAPMPDAADRSACRLAMGVLGGVAGAFAGGWAGGRLEQAVYHGNPEAGLTGALVGVVAGAVVGNRAARTACPDGDGASLEIRLIGNAGATLSDDTTTLLVDLPYESGAFGYMAYDPDALRPAGAAVSVITHDHRDHFDADLFRSRVGWRIIGPPSVTVALPRDRVLPGDSVAVGSFDVVAIPSPHTEDHRSYRIRWRGRVLYFTGDTEDPSSIPTHPGLDLLFITPWLSCSLPPEPLARRTVLYHLRPEGSDRACGSAERLEPGRTIKLPARHGSSPSSP